MATTGYPLPPAYRVQVVNRCPQPCGKLDQAISEGRRVGPGASATLPVRLAAAWLSYLPKVWVDYWVVDLDATDQLAVVSEPGRQFLWVLPHEPGLPSAD